MRSILTFGHGRCLTALLSVVAVAISMTACSSARHVQPSTGTDRTTAAIEAHLRQAARDWEGTPHRLGGLDHNGIDCSGLVVRIYADLFNRRLPRTTGALARYGRPTAPRDLAPGDLVLFRPPGSKQHVGIYLGRNEFVHAATTRGVMISRLDERYWRRSFWTARRVLD